MHLIARRTVVAAAGSLAAVATWRKPAAAELGTFEPSDPPAVPPAISFTDADGRAHGLAEFVGKGIVLNCWATWCAPCVKEMPALAALAGALRQSGVVVLPLSSDRAGVAVVAKFYQDHEIGGLDVWLDPHGDATRALRLRGIPTTLIIDREGREQARVEGGVDWTAPEILARVRELVAR